MVPHREVWKLLFSFSRGFLKSKFQMFLLLRVWAFGQHRGPTLRPWWGLWSPWECFQRFGMGWWFRFRVRRYFGFFGWWYCFRVQRCSRGIDGCFRVLCFCRRAWADPRGCGCWSYFLRDLFWLNRFWPMENTCEWRWSVFFIVWWLDLQRSEGWVRFFCYWIQK